MPICFVKWEERALWIKTERTGAVVGWVGHGTLDDRLWAIIMSDGKFEKVQADKLEFVRWPKE